MGSGNDLRKFAFGYYLALLVLCTIGLTLHLLDQKAEICFYFLSLGLIVFAIVIAWRAEANGR